GFAPNTVSGSARRRRGSRFPTTACRASTVPGLSGHSGRSPSARPRHGLSDIIRAMRAVQIVQETGPDSALELVELEDPQPSHMLTPGAGVVVDVHAAGVSFPEVLQTRGQYQMKPPLPFVPGSEVVGVVRSASDGASVKAGDRVAAFCALGGFA